MHELSLVHAMLQQVESLMKEHAAVRVTSVRVSVGEFSGVEPELFRSAYDLLVQGTPIQGAELELVPVPLESRCGDCGREFAIEHFCFKCPACKSTSLTTLRGEGLVLESVAIERD